MSTFCGKIHTHFFIKRTIGIGHRYTYTTEVKVKLETKFGLIPSGEDIELGICSIVFYPAASLDKDGYVVYLSILTMSLGQS